MDETRRSDTTTETTGQTATTGAVREKTRKGVPWGVLIVLLIIAFGAGFLWQFYAATTAREELSAVEQELEVERLRIHLGQAALAAHAGNFEAARSQMSGFFSTLQEKSQAMPGEVRLVAEDFLTMRDEVITGLSRSNPEYAAVLYGMVEDLGEAIARSRGEAAPPATPPVGEGPSAPGAQPSGSGTGELDPSG